MIDVILLCTVFGVFLCFTFIKGIQIGQSIANNKLVEMPSLNIAKKVQEIKQNKQDQEEIYKMNTILENIENYDGTDTNQKEV